MGFSQPSGIKLCQRDRNKELKRDGKEYGVGLTPILTFVTTLLTMAICSEVP